MSEPRAALTQVTIERGTLIAFLNSSTRPASCWADWKDIGGKYHGFSWEKDLPQLLEETDRQLKGTYRESIRAVMDHAEHPQVARCTYDDATRTFMFTTLTFSENLTEYVWFFAVSRGIADFLRNKESGFALLNDYFWVYGEPEPAVVMGLGADGYSGFLNQKRDDPAFEQHVRDATAIFDSIQGGLAPAIYHRILGAARIEWPKDQGPPPIDHLDRLR
jgi:hypothetical protein